MAQRTHEGHRKRLKQTYMEHGDKCLHDHQTLELLLTYCIPRSDTNPLAHRLLDAFGSLEAIFKAEPRELMGEKGVGENTAILLSLVGGMFNRVRSQSLEVECLNTPNAAAQYCVSLFYKHRYEAMYVISLDKKLRAIHADCISSGTLTETMAYPRLVVERALIHKADSVIITHNHPSGDPTPSVMDLEATQRILQAVKPVGIMMYDHIIVGDRTAYSMVRDSTIKLNSPHAPEARAAEDKE